MRGETAEVVLADSGFWLALLDHTDQHHNEAVSVADLISRMQCVVPWPVLYETLSTRTVRSHVRVQQLVELLNLEGITVCDDQPYRDDALDAVGTVGNRASLVDATLRRMVQDRTLRIDYFVSFNLQDFSDVCTARGVHTLP